MYSFRMRWYAAFAVALTSALSGCGSAYQDAANGICRDLQADVGSIPVPHQPRNLGRYLEMNLFFAREANRRFDALVPPDDLATDHRRLEQLNARGERALADLARRVDRSRRPARTLERGFRALDPLVAESNRHARSAGLEDCVEELPGAEPPRPRGTSRA
jgi:hypothetical protein